jgi:hypothetical protein
MARASAAILRGEAEAGVLHRWDARRSAHRQLALKRDPACVACGRPASEERRS